LARNNRSRLGKELGDTEVPQDDPVAATTQADGLSFATPTEFVELPSRGLCYAADHPLCGVESVEIKYMTAKEEDILSSKTLIKQGVAIERFLKSIIIDKSIRTDSLVTGDRNAILVAARINGYGSEYSTKVTCPSCFTSSDYEFDLSEVEIKEFNENPEDATWTDSGNLLATTPITGVEVETRPLTGKDEMYLARTQESKRKKKLAETTLTDLLKTIVVSVNGKEERNLINEFIEVMPARDSRHLRTTYEENIPNVDMTQEFECPNCNYRTALEVPFTTDFFWPK